MTVSPEKRRVIDWRDRLMSQSAPSIEVRSCHCMGPRPGEPLCPCRMRGVKILHGRYVEIVDHGPVPADLGLEE